MDGSMRLATPMISYWCASHLSFAFPSPFSLAPPPLGRARRPHGARPLHLQRTGGPYHAARPLAARAQCQGIKPCMHRTCVYFDLQGATHVWDAWQVTDGKVLGVGLPGRRQLRV
jgi:hypothetical protein